MAWNKPTMAVIIGIAAIGLTGCTAQHSDAVPTTAPSAPASNGSATSSGTSVAESQPTASASSSTTASATSCGTDNGTTAVQQAMLRIPDPIPSDPAAHWDAPHADLRGYDPCSSLSWAILGVFDGTPSSPNAILLFHDGDFLGTATSVQYPFEPTVSRTTAESISVTYRYAKPGDANANPSGTTHATFSWNAAEGKVVMTGQVPHNP